MARHYYVLTDLEEHKVSLRGDRPKNFVRFEVQGRPLYVNEHVKLFIWFHPLSMRFHVHEVSTGSFIASGASEAEARENTGKAFLATNENKFFDALERFGNVLEKPEIPFNEAVRRMRAFLMANKGNATITKNPLFN
jgi:hypothetical protein